MTAIPELSACQLKVLRAVIENEDQTEAALIVGVSPSALRQHLTQIRRILHTRTTMGAVVVAIKRGILDVA
jgi:DNA-binding CsgD family transcriptional regulator